MIIVAADGTADYMRIQEAIDSLAEERAEETVIYVRSGVYEEKLYITKPSIRLIGESAETTIITNGDYAKKLFPNGEPYQGCA
ncbi:pectinesterase family protein [Paenibacillus chondroitinus]|uniref:Pectinesterase family protein n=1 Tax=Paenibacillus chondroitinus TaxID=59842 RepID=A0ABU6DJU8_9BACL|nr:MULTISPECIES: pectinesterase family protein [Paenibacillus]MCY9661036.1 pectinesterase family protein [Paenibacillus anseongense]MEB4797904.1 pectinesterase family protein [Paenibacillus chondroitinus]